MELTLLILSPIKYLSRKEICFVYEEISTSLQLSLQKCQNTYVLHNKLLN